MLHRLLTLPSQGLGQLLCDDASMDALPLAAEASPSPSPSLLDPPADPRTPPGRSPAEGQGLEEEEEGVEPEPMGPPPAQGKKAYVCRRCGKRFARLPLLRTHQQTHTEATPPRCSLCGKRFAQESRLQAHLRTHAGKST